MLKKVISSQDVVLHFSPSSQDRKYSRFTNSLGSLVELDLKFQDPLFVNGIKGLVINDSLGGCSLIVATTEIFESEQICLMRSEGLSPIKVRIVWVKTLDMNIFRLGIEYLDQLDSDEFNLS